MKLFPNNQVARQRYLLCLTTMTIDINFTSLLVPHFKDHSKVATCHYRQAVITQYWP